MPTTKLVCFDTHARVAGYVADWFDTKLKTMKLETAACGYNLGFKYPEKLKNCPYWQNFLKLN